MHSIPHASGIYQILCIPTSKIYIGSSSDLFLRWASHRAHLARGTHHTAHLQFAWNKYGADQFRFEVIELCEPSMLIEREQYHIDRTRCYDRSYGFNSRKVADSNLGMKISPEASVRLSQLRRGKKRGPMSDDVRRAISQAPRKVYKRHSNDVRKAKSERQKGHSTSLETRAKISAAHKGRSVHPNTEHAKVEAKSKNWIVTDPSGNEYLIRNLEMFCREHGLIATSMGCVASGKQRQHKGWKCRRLE